jgi:hypothetical protein
MNIVKSFSVGYGETFYIRHNTDNFTIIDCCLTEETKEQIVAELKREGDSKGIRRLFRPHPDEDHYRAIEYLDRKMPIHNFYCVQNKVNKDDETDSFTHYRSLRDGSQAYYVSKGCTRRWMNISDNEREHAGIHILWPNTSNAYFKAALRDAEDGIAFNNISLVAKYCGGNNARMLWLGDLETEFMENIEFRSPRCTSSLRHIMGARAGKSRTRGSTN